MDQVRIVDNFGDAVCVTALPGNNQIYFRVDSRGGDASVAVSLDRAKVKLLRRELKRLLQESKV